MGVIHAYGIYIVLLGWCAGVVGNYMHDRPLYSLWLVIPIFFACAWKYRIICIVFTLSCIGGWLQYEMYYLTTVMPIAEKSRELVFTQEGKEKTIIGNVISKPACLQSGCEFSVEITEPDRHSAIHVFVRTRATPRTMYGTYTSPAYGDTVTVRGNVVYARRKHHKKHIFSEMRSASLLETHTYQGPALSMTNVVRNLYRVRDRFSGTIQQLLDAPKSNLLAGLIIEGGASLPADLKKQFNATGLSHIVALSGFNVTIILEAVFFALSRCTRMVRISVGSVFVVGFGVMTGLSSPIIRASIMALIQLTGELLYRRYHALRALLVSGFMMVIWNPYYLLEDVSFQLSIAATLGLLLGTDICAACIEKLENYKRMYTYCIDTYIGRAIGQTLATTLSAQIFVLPLIALYMGSISLIAPVSNVLVLLIIPWTMLAGFLAVVIAHMPYIHSFSGLFILICTWMLSYILYIVHVCSRIPYGTIQIFIQKTHAVVWIACACIVVALLRRYLRLRSVL